MKNIEYCKNIPDQHIVENDFDIKSRLTILELADKPEHENIKEDLYTTFKLSETFSKMGGKSLIVGGFVRDQLLNEIHGMDLSPKDIDMEVYGVELDELANTLEGFGNVNKVGESFSIYKLGNLDISIPRQDSKVDKGHRGFQITGNPYMSVREAARRRDFTINALAMDPLSGEIIDEFEGIKDIKNKILRATDPELFKDDPLRALRAAQFAGRFEFDIDPTTMQICQHLPLHELPAERIKEEWDKLLLKSEKPSHGLMVAKEIGIIDKLHPELKNIIGCLQDERWHPEGDVWEHTLMVADSANQIANHENLSKHDKFILMYASLCHDLGKFETTQILPNGNITSHGHCIAGVKPAKSFLNSLKIPKKYIEKILPLVENHLFPTLCKDSSDKAVKKLSRRLFPATIKHLVMLAEADHRGRAIEFDGFLQGQQLLERAKLLEIAEKKPEPILMGRHLINLGHKPGPVFKKILDRAYELQLENKINNIEEALLFATNYSIINI